MAERGKKCPPPPPNRWTQGINADDKMVEESHKWWINKNNRLAALGQLAPFPGTSGTFLFPWHCFSIGLLSKLKLLWRFDNSILFSALWWNLREKDRYRKHNIWQILNVCLFIFVIFSLLKKCSFIHCFKKNLWMLWNSPACQMRHQKCSSPVRYCQWHLLFYKQELGAIVFNTCHLWPPDHRIVREG